MKLGQDLGNRAAHPYQEFISPGLSGFFFFQYISTLETVTRMLWLLLRTGQERYKTQPICLQIFVLCDPLHLKVVFE